MSNTAKALIILLGGAAAGVVIGLQGGGARPVAAIVGTLVLGALILTRPYIGIIATIAAVPLESLYPDTPFGTSIVSLIGLITLTSYLVKERFAIRSRIGLAWVYRFAILFLFWLLATNPLAAVSGGGRNWVFTYLQLFILMWLGAEELTLPRQRLLMLVFASITAFSALATLDITYLSDAVYRSSRAEGFSDNANMFAVYLNVSIAFTLYFIVTPHLHRLLRLAMVGVLGILMLGVAMSVSRAGAIAMVTLLIAGVIWYSKLSAETASQHRLRNFFSLLVLAAAIYVIAQVFVPAQYWSILEEARRLIEEGTEAQKSSYAIRLNLWDEALILWRNSPIWGIGAGKFFEAAKHVAHNMYIQVLTEQGIIGLAFFLSWLGTIVATLMRAMYRSDDSDKVAMATAWLLALMAILVMGLSGSWHLYSKNLWLLAGISTAYLMPRVRKAVQQPAPAPQLVPTST